MEIGMRNNRIRCALGLNPVQFHALMNREFTVTRHRWTDEEEMRLLQLYVIHGTNWDVIKDALNEKFGCSLTNEQVRNRFYMMKRKTKVPDIVPVYRFI